MDVEDSLHFSHRSKRREVGLPSKIKIVDVLYLIFEFYEIERNKVIDFEC